MGLKILKSLRTQKSNFTLLRKISQIHLTFLLIILAEIGPFYPLQMFEKFAEHLNRTSNLSEHPFVSQNRTSNLPNITKNRTIREHRTVRSTSSQNPEISFLQLTLKNKYCSKCISATFLFFEVSCKKLISGFWPSEKPLFAWILVYNGILFQ